MRKEKESSNLEEEMKEVSKKEAVENKKETKEVAKLKEELAKANEEKEKAISDMEHWKNQYYMAYADTQNLRKSIEEEKRVALRYRSEGFLTNLLPALDAFYLALEASPNNEEAKNYQIGFKYIYNQIQKAIEDEGVTELTPKVGDNYDLSLMHAVEAEESDGEENKVLKVFAKGYKLHDRLIRPAMVVVSKKAGENKEEKVEDQKFDA